MFLRAGTWVTLSPDAPVTYPKWKQNVENALLREALQSGTGKRYGMVYSS